MNKIITIVLAMFLFGGHAVQAEQAAKQEAPKDDAKKEAGAKKDVFFVKMDQMAFTVYKPQGINFILSTVFVFETDTEEKKQKIRDTFPYLQDAFTRFLTDIGSQNPMRVRDVKSLKSIVQTICDRVLGKGVVNAVLLENYGERVF